MIQSLTSYIRALHTLSTAAELALQEVFEEVNIKKNDLLVEEGKVCRHLYFLYEGALRGYYLLDGKEITYGFCFAKDFVTSFHSFITGKPAVEHIQAIEPSRAWRISKEKLQHLIDEHHELERILRLAYEQYYIRLEERFVNAQFKTTGERYDQLLEQMPHILRRVPLGQVAAYLGISQETLSRIRSRV